MRTGIIGAANLSARPASTGQNQLAYIALLCGFLLGPLPSLAASVSDVPANPFDYVHATNLAYDPVTGVLVTSTTEPGIPSVCSVKTDTPDSYGNNATVVISNCTGATGRALFPSRTVASTTYAAVASQSITVGGSSVPVAIAPGISVSSSSDALSQVTTYQNDPRFGLAIQITKPGNRTTKTGLDDFGRVTKITAADGTSTVQGYCLLTAQGGLDTSQTSNTPGCTGYASQFAAPLVPPRANLAIFLQEYDASSALNGPLKITFHDSRGRVVRVATEGFDGSSQPSGFSAAWVVTDTVYDAYGNAVLQTSPYYLSNGSARTTGSNDVAVTLTQFDATGRPVATISSSSADASRVQTFGGSGSFGYGSYGTRSAAALLQTYAGMTQTETNDKGATRTTVRTASQAIARVTDANGAQLAFQYDSFGNLIKTTDALQNSRTSTVNYLGDVEASYDPDRGLLTTCLDAIGQIKASQTSAMRGSDSAPTCPDNPDNGTAATPVANWTTFAYDVAGRVVEEYGSESKSHFFFKTYSDLATNCDSGVSTLCESTMTVGLNIKRNYDALGRQVAERKDVVGDSVTFTRVVAFDAITGRVSNVTYPTGVQVAYSYTPRRGFTQGMSLVNGAVINPLPNANNVTVASQTLVAGSSLWQANVVSADGKYEKTTFGSGVVTQQTYEPGTGRPMTIFSGPATSPRQIMDYAETWDSLGNVASRLDNLGSGTGAVGESFGYDSLNRLSNYAVQGPDLPGYERFVQLGYNALGMLLSKSDVGNYAYNAQGVRHPHALQSLSGGTAANYGYDLDGNLQTATAGKYTLLTYTSKDLIATAANAGSAIQYSWLYDQEDARVREVRVTSANTRKTWYDNSAGGLFFESESDSAPAGTTNRHYLTVDGTPIGMLQTNGALPILQPGQFPTVSSVVTFNKFEYWHRDNLGSLIATSDHLQNSTAHYSYDPFGLRRFAGGGADTAHTLVVDWDSTHNSGSARGFTGHEEMDDMGLVNMNGRLYDAGVGLVIQADPHITNQYNLQNYNNYAYVLNNPLNATDPTGFDVSDFGAQSSVSMYGGISTNFGQMVDLGSLQIPTEALADFVQLNNAILATAAWGKTQFSAMQDGWRDNRTSGSNTNNGGSWGLGRTSSLLVTGTVGLVKTGIDAAQLYSVDMTGAFLCAQCPQPHMLTPLGGSVLALQTGELKPVVAAKKAVASVVGIPGRTKEDFRTGGLPEVFAQAATFAIGGFVGRMGLVGDLAEAGTGTVLSETASATAPAVNRLSESRALTTFYPANNGFLGTARQMTLEEGQSIDRFGGSDYARFFSPPGTPIAARALPPGVGDQARRTFQVVKPFDVQAGKVAPAFNQFGLGMQYRSEMQLGDLLSGGFLKEIKP